MRLDEIHQKDNPELFTDAFILEAWEQGRGELLGFAKHLDRSNAGITASQLRMAIQLADKTFDGMKLAAHGEPPR